MDLVGADGVLIGRYRKMHIPGSEQAQAGVTTHLERRYFSPGNLVSPSMLIAACASALHCAMTGAGRKLIGCLASMARRWF